jgi:hypothetical protein
VEWMYLFLAENTNRKLTITFPPPYFSYFQEYFSFLGSLYGVKVVKASYKLILVDYNADVFVFTVI